MADQLNRVVVRKELNKFVTFVNELQKEIQRRLNYLESNIINKKTLKQVIKEDRGRITSLQEENTLLRRILFEKFPELREKYVQAGKDRQGAVTLLDLGKSDGKLKL